MAGPTITQTTSGQTRSYWSNDTLSHRSNILIASRSQRTRIPVDTMNHQEPESKCGLGIFPLKAAEWHCFYATAF